MEPTAPSDTRTSATRTADTRSAPALAVVIPCKNGEATLGEQLAAVAVAGARWPGPWEVVVADNGSTDRSRQVAESFSGDGPGRIPRLRVVDSSGRGGPGHSRNAGAAAVSGEVERILFCDADDRVDAGWVLALGRALDTHDLVASRYETELLNPPGAGRRHPQETGLNPYDYPVYLPHAGGGGLGVRRAVHEEAGGFDESLPALEDTDYCWRIQRAGCSFAWEGNAVVHIRFRHRLRDDFLQSYRYGRYNVFLYRRYRAMAEDPMPRLSPWMGPAKGVKLLLTWPKLLLPTARAGWIAQLGWRLGRLDGCLRYRVWAP
jgi:glycosyltransferase involved in cell wall biosynthesis